jgi:ring-1,2-phenylacetyl-CoA epoxidase subunit PaaC
MQAALNEMWRYLPELFQDDEVDAFAAQSQFGPAWSSLKDVVMGQMGSLLAEAKLTPPPESSFRTTGRNGIHSEHLGFILSELQYLQRAYPGGVW